MYVKWRHPSLGCEWNFLKSILVLVSVHFYWTWRKGKYTVKIMHVSVSGGGESNGNLPLRTCPGCSVPEPYRSPDWVLVPAKNRPKGWILMNEWMNEWMLKELLRNASFCDQLFCFPAKVKLRRNELIKVRRTRFGWCAWNPIVHPRHIMWQSYEGHMHSMQCGARI